MGRGQVALLGYLTLAGCGPEAVEDTAWEQPANCEPLWFLEERTEDPRREIPCGLGYYCPAPGGWECRPWWCVSPEVRELGVCS